METRFVMPLIRNLIIFGVFIWFSFNELSKEVGHSQWPLNLKGQTGQYKSVSWLYCCPDRVQNGQCFAQPPSSSSTHLLLVRTQTPRCKNYAMLHICNPLIYKINSKIWSHNIQHTKFYKIMDNCIRNQETTNWMPL